jgi:hypothetical protein
MIPRGMLWGGGGAERTGTCTCCYNFAMGAWGIGPLENDSAADFVGDLKRAPMAKRLEMLADAFTAYLAFDAGLRAGRNVVKASAQDIAELRASREAAIAANRANGMEDKFLEMLPEYASEAAFEAHVAEMSGPMVDDGSHQAQTVVAAAWVLVSAHGGGDRSLGKLLPAADQHSGALAGSAARALQAVLENHLFAESWQPSSWRTLAETIRQLALTLESLPTPST